MNPGRRVEDLLEILREIEFIEYEDPDDGLIIFCPVCGGYPEPEKLTSGTKNLMAPRRARSGKGHDKNCKLALALYGPG